MKFSRRLMILLLSFGFLVSIAEAAAKPVVHLEIFLSPDCSHCISVHAESLQALGTKIGCKIEPRYFDIRDAKNYRKLVEMEDLAKATENEMPVVFIGKEVIEGPQAIQERLESVITRYAAQGGVDLPDQKTSLIKNSKKTVSPSSDFSKKKAVRAEDKNTAVLSDKDFKSLGISVPEKTPAKEVSPQSKTPDTKIPATQQHPKIDSTKIYMAFFYQTSCKECDRVFYLIQYLKTQHPNLILREFDLRENQNKILDEAIGVRLHVPEKKRLVPATLFIGSDFLQMHEITERRVDAILAKYEKTGSPCPWIISQSEKKQAEEHIRNRFRSLGVLTVAVAGLLDGINPCAFTTLVFLISYLAYLKRKRQEILEVGMVFTAAVFVTYLLIGCGFFAGIRYLGRFHFISLAVNLLVAVLVILFGFYSFADFLKARKGKTEEIRLQLPGFLKKRIHQSVRAQKGSSGYLAAAAVSGITISFLELACTGQVYLPTIVFVANQQGTRASGFADLLLYNILFILPLAAVFFVAYRGMTSEILGQFAKKHLPTVKLATAILFLALGIVLILNILR